MKRTLLVAILIVACSDKPAPQYEHTTIVQVDREAPRAPVPAPRSTAFLPASTRQLITGVIDSWSTSRAQLQLWTRSSADAAWTKVGAPWDAVIGRRGAAWGDGIANFSGAPQKKEGDGNAPAGVFRLRGAYGYAAAPPDGTKLPYTPADRLECVDDPGSRHYTEIVDGSRADRDWKSSEQMRGNHDQYTWVIDIAHNPDQTPGRGSCIFFHVWGGADTTTDGCTAMAEDKLVELMTTLDPASEPLYVLLPRAHYDSFRATWGLP